MEKLTDEQIVKDLCEMTYGGHSCMHCKYGATKGDDRCGLQGCKIGRDALDLINRQKETIKRQVEAIKASHKLVEEIKAELKRLETILDTRCEKCPRTETSEMSGDAKSYKLLWLDSLEEIERLKSENKELDKENDAFVNLLDEKCNECVAFNNKQAIKGFAERLKEELGEDVIYEQYPFFGCAIDNVVKEMTEQKNDFKE